MFKVSQEIFLGSNSSVTTSGQSNVYGKYNKVSEDGLNNLNDKKIFIAPELTEIEKIEFLHLPNDDDILEVNKPIEFYLKKNGARGNFEAKLINPMYATEDLKLENNENDDRLIIKFIPNIIGNYKILIKLNDVDVKLSPINLNVIDNKIINNILLKFISDAKQIKSHGLGLKEIKINNKNEFTIDASRAGNNILFVGICGPKGQCEEVSIKHIGKNIYNVIFRIDDPGQYMIVIKWGDDHIPGSPFQLVC